MQAIRIAWRASEVWWGRAIALTGVGAGLWLGLHESILAGKPAWPAAAVVVIATLLGGPIFVALGGLALGHVAQEQPRHVAAGQRERRQLQRDGPAVAAQHVEFVQAIAAAHGAALQIAQQAAGLQFVRVQRHQQRGQRLAQGLAARPAQQSFGGRVALDHATCRVGGEHAVALTRQRLAEYAGGTE